MDSSTEFRPWEINRNHLLTIKFRETLVDLVYHWGYADREEDDEREWSEQEENAMTEANTEAAGETIEIYFVASLGAVCPLPISAHDQANQLVRYYGLGRQITEQDL